MSEHVFFFFFNSSEVGARNKSLANCFAAKRKGKRNDGNVTLTKYEREFMCECMGVYAISHHGTRFCLLCSFENYALSKNTQLLKVMKWQISESNKDVDRAKHRQLAKTKQKRACHEYEFFLSGELLNLSHFCKVAFERPAFDSVKNIRSIMSSYYCIVFLYALCSI